MKKSTTKIVLTQIGSTRKKTENLGGFDAALVQLGAKVRTNKKELVTLD